MLCVLTQALVVQVSGTVWCRFSIVAVANPLSLDQRRAQEEPKAVTDWKEHKAPDGRTYYFSKTLNKSVWKLPEELRLQREAAAGGAAAAKPGAAAARPLPGPPPGPPAVQVRYCHLY